MLKVQNVQGAGGTAGIDIREVRSYTPFDKRLPGNLVYGHTFGQALQRPAAKGAKCVTTVAIGHRPDEWCAKDLAWPCVGAESGRLDHRRAEGISCVLGDLSDAEPHPHLNRIRVGAVLGCEGLLDRNGGVDRVSHALEHLHYAIAEGLHFDTPVLAEHCP
ncbi:MAG: hypothetical protein NVS3B21_22990 [Acidimicrobiales bacterium]